MILLGYRHHVFPAQKLGSRAFRVVCSLDACKATPQLLSLWQMARQREILDEWYLGEFLN